MKLVVVYHHGGYEGTWTENACVEYESKEHFLCAFIDAFEKLAEYKKKTDVMYKQISDAIASQDKVKIEKSIEARRVHENNSLSEYGYLVVNGEVFSEYQDFEKVGKEYVLIGLPDVYTLDEWFELNRPDRK